VTAEPIDPGTLNAVQVLVDRLMEQGELEMRPDNQCKVCRDPVVRALVNVMLTRMSTLQDIFEVLEPYNLTKKYKARISYDSVRRHRINHFPIQVPHSVVLRKITEDYATAMGRDIATYAGSLVTSQSYLKSVMIRGMEDVGDPEVRITAMQGANAAVKLHDIESADEGLLDRAKMLVELGRVIELVQSFVPKEKWPALQAALRGDLTAVESTMTPKTTTIRMVEIDDASDFEAD
jgi:hypothetical protein